MWQFLIKAIKNILGFFVVFQKTYQNNGYFEGDSGLVGTVVILQFPFNWKKKSQIWV